MKTRYFPNLNALRFYAAVSVVVAHLLWSFQELRPAQLQGSVLELVFLDGPAAVTLFFVLSGFLITYLLLNEKFETKTIRVKAFWMRRILRIWPLYYLIAVIGVSVFPLLFGRDYRINDFGAAEVGLLIANLNVPYLAMLSHLWSISLEEQFYLVWPVLLKQRKLTPVTVMLAIIGIRILLTPLALATDDLQLQHLWIQNRVESMCIGGLAAWVVLNKLGLLKAIYRFQVPILLLFAVFIVVQFSESLPATLASSLVFAGVIVNVATNPQSILKLETPLTKRLGDLSYGIYMFHYPILYGLCIVLKDQSVTAGTNLLLVVGTFAGTFTLSVLSHRFFEAPFLRMKTRYQVRSRSRSLALAGTD